MIGPKDRDSTELNFSKLLQVLKTRDRDLWSLAAGQLDKERWRQMLKEVQDKDPDLYQEVIKVYDALIQGQEEMVNSPRVPVLSRAWELAGKLLKNYSCEKGYLVYEEPRIHTATIHLNIEKVVTGLPRELMALSNKIAWDYGGERKWTFGFDNRIFIADLTEDAIEELRKNPAVARVEIEPMAYICSNEIPRYNPNGVNIDWGVDRVNPENAWNKGIFGQGVKVCVIDTGIKSSHECFWKDGVCVFKGGWNFITNNNRPVDDHDHGCLSPDGLIYTSLGLETIESFWERFVIGEEEEIDISDRNIWTVALDTNTPAISIARINKVFKIPVNGDIVAVKTRSGLELKLTPWHPTFVFDGEKIVEKRADALKDGDFLLRPAVNTLLPQQKQEVAGVIVDEDLAYALGLFLGDGFFRPAYQDSIGLSNTDSKVGRRFLEICGPLSTSIGIVKDKRTGVPSYMAYGKRLYQLMRNLTEIPEGKSKTYNLAVPQVISRSPSAVIGAFLAGYFDADGHVSVRSNTALWSTVSRDMANQLAFLLSLLGIKAHLVTCKAKRTNEVDCYQVTITGIDEVRKLYQWIKPYLTSGHRIHRLEKIVAKPVSWNVRNTGVPLSAETIDRLRKEGKEAGLNGTALKGGKDRRSAKGPAKYRLMEFLNQLKNSEVAEYYRRLAEAFHFDQVISVERQSYQGHFYDLNVEGHHNYLAGNFGATFIHNTYCAGIIAAQHNGIAGSYKGISPGVELYACKVLDAKGSGSFANVAAAIDWARTNGMHIISMSLGGSAGSSTLQQACDAAWYAGLVLCAAAGNAGPGDNTVTYPARYNSCIAVAATDYYDDVPNFSSRGPEVDMAAPGRRIVGPWAGITYKDYVVSGSNGRYMCASGTSAACPHVAAGAALVKSWYPLATNVEIRQWITEHCRDI